MVAVLSLLIEGIAVTKSLVDVAKLYKKESKNLDKAAALAAALNDVLILGKPSDDSMDEVKKKLTELSNQINEVSTSIESQLDQIKGQIFLSNPSVVQSSKNMLHLSRLLANINESTIKDFKTKIDGIVRLDDALTVIILLLSVHTNPLALVMEKENPKTAATFDKWEKIIARILYQFLFVEAFRSGLDGDSQANYLETKITEVEEKLSEWRTDYQEKNWKEEVEKLLLKTPNSVGAVQSIVEELDKWVSNNVQYYVIKYASTSLMDGAANALGFKIDNFITTDESKIKNKCIMSIQHNDRNIIVYRSKFWNNVSDGLAKSLEATFKTMSDTFPTRPTYKDYTQEILRSSMSNYPVDFVGVFQRRLEVSVAFSPSKSNLKNGPGVYSELVMNNNTIRYEHTVVVGFK